MASARELGIDVPIIPGVIPIASFGQVARICDLCDATIPAELEEAMQSLGGDEEAEGLLGVAYAAQQCEELLAAGAPGIHFYALNRAPGHARRARGAAGLAPVGARRGRASAPRRRRLTAPLGSPR